MAQPHGRDSRPNTNEEACIGGQSNSPIVQIYSMIRVFLMGLLVGYFLGAHCFWYCFNMSRIGYMGLGMVLGYLMARYTLKKRASSPRTDYPSVTFSP